MPTITSEKKSLIPVIVMIGFTLLLIGALLIKVYQADRDLGRLRSEKYQARLASESGINYAIEKMREAIKTSDRPVTPEVLTSMFFEDRIEIDKWIDFGVKTKSKFRVTSIRKLNSEDDKNSPLIDEGQQYQVLSEGLCGVHRYSTGAIVQLYDLAKLFGVFQSLDEYYYGTPLQPYVVEAGSFNQFHKANEEFFNAGLITNQGKILEPGLLAKMYEPNGKAVFNNTTNNYSKYYSRSGVSPSKGPIYCSLPVVVDDHQFNAPVQTALYFYCRPNTNPVIKGINSVRKMNSSSRLQHVTNNVGRRNLTKYFVDRDSIKYSSYIPSWSPDINHLRELCKSRGIYIDQEGKGYLNGTPMDVDYHPGQVTMYSDSYMTANSSAYEQDELKDEKYIVLGSEAKYDGYNNISGVHLQGARMIFSERSVYIRGEIGSDLIVITPHHIFITGPTNFDSSLNLLLIGAEGTAISTVDLEEVISKSNPSPDFIEAAREWMVRAAIYKPGAGIYSAESRVQKDSPISFKGLFGGKSLRLHIVGSCVGGNLQRWINNSESDSLLIEHDPACVERLAVSPVTANLLKLRTRPVNPR